MAQGNIEERLRGKWRKLHRMQADASPKRTKAMSQEAGKEKASPHLTAAMQSQECPAETLVHPCSPTTQERPPQHTRVEGKVVSADSTPQTSIDLLPRNPCDAREINCLRVQLFHKNDAMRNIPKKNENYKKKRLG